MIDYCLFRKKTTEDTLEIPYDYSDLNSFVKKCYNSRLQEGIPFPAASRSDKVFQKKIQESDLVCIAAEDKKIIGMGALTFRGDYAYEHTLCISNDYRGRGIGQGIVLQLSKNVDSNIKYIKALTAEKAVSSVKLHKKCGFYVVGLASYNNTPYYSYIMELFLSPSKYDKFLYRKVKFAKSYIVCKCLYKSNGQLRGFAKTIKGLYGNN